MQQAPAVSSAVLPASSAVPLVKGSTRSQAPTDKSEKTEVALQAASGGKQSETDKIQAAVPLDWKRYTLKASVPKVIQNKTYHTYDISDEDYIVGPKILIDPNSGNVYTWTSSDAAPVPAAEDKAFDKTEHTIVGTVEDGAMMNVVLKTDSGNELIVRRVGIDTSGLTSMKIGDRIRVTYSGVINGNDTSRAFITKLETVK
jgi:pectate lyase